MLRQVRQPEGGLCLSQRHLSRPVCAPPCCETFTNKIFSRAEVEAEPSQKWTSQVTMKDVWHNSQNLNTFVKDRELHCCHNYFSYDFPLPMIRSVLQEPKEKTAGPRGGPVRDAVTRQDTPPRQTGQLSGHQWTHHTPLRQTAGAAAWSPVDTHDTPLSHCCTSRRHY